MCVPVIRVHCAGFSMFVFLHRILYSVIPNKCSFLLSFLSCRMIMLIVSVGQRRTLTQNCATFITHRSTSETSCWQQESYPLMHFQVTLLDRTVSLGWNSLAVTLKASE